MTYKQRLLLVYHYLPQEGCFYEEVQEIMILNVLRRLKGFPCRWFWLDTDKTNNEVRVTSE